MDMGHHIEKFFKKLSIIDYLKKNKVLPLKSIETLDTLKLLNMMYKSSEKRLD